MSLVVRWVAGRDGAVFTFIPSFGYAG
jgi:hypothetical protein